MKYLHITHQINTQIAPFIQDPSKSQKIAQLISSLKEQLQTPEFTESLSTKEKATLQHKLDYYYLFNKFVSEFDSGDNEKYLAPMQAELFAIGYSEEPLWDNYLDLLLATGNVELFRQTSREYLEVCIQQAEQILNGSVESKDSPIDDAFLILEHLNQRYSGSPKIALAQHKFETMIKKKYGYSNSIVVIGTALAEMVNKVVTSIQQSQANSANSKEKSKTQPSSTRSKNSIAHFKQLLLGNFTPDHEKQATNHDEYQKELLAYIVKTPTLSQLEIFDRLVEIIEHYRGDDSRSFTNALFTSMLALQLKQSIVPASIEIKESIEKKMPKIFAFLRYTCSEYFEFKNFSAALYLVTEILFFSHDSGKIHKIIREIHLSCAKEAENQKRFIEHLGHLQQAIRYTSDAKEKEDLETKLKFLIAEKKTESLTETLDPKHSPLQRDIGRKLKANHSVSDLFAENSWKAMQLMDESTFEDKFIELQNAEVPDEKNSLAQFKRG